MKQRTEKGDVTITDHLDIVIADRWMCWCRLKD